MLGGANNPENVKQYDIIEGAYRFLTKSINGIVP